METIRRQYAPPVPAFHYSYGLQRLVRLIERNDLTIAKYALDLLSATGIALSLVATLVLR